jgi:hypothetical protein
MPRLLGLCTALAAILLVATPARADVSWDFIATSIDRDCPSCCPSCPPPHVPMVVATLTVSDAAFLRGSLSYSYVGNHNTGEITSIGDTDFYFNYFFYFPLPIDPINFFVNGGAVELSFSSNGEISGSIFDSTPMSDIRMVIYDSNVDDAFFGEDGGDIAVCGQSGSQTCLVDGYWQLTSALPQRIPEPSPLSILLGAITGLGIMRQRAVLARLRSA